MAAQPATALSLTEPVTAVSPPVALHGSPLYTPLCELLKIRHPVMLAGMASVTGSDLASAVSNAGGSGSFGGVLMTPEALRKEIQFTREQIQPGMKFGVDLALPQLGGNARKTNHDYTKGRLGEMVDIIVENSDLINLFVCAIGVPPKWVVDKFHSVGIVCGNMVGAPHHVAKALEVGVDLIIAQGTEAGGHTGDISTLVLVPQCVDAVAGKINFFGSPVLVVAAGGISDGRGLAASLSLGAAGVWVGTRFIACEEACASKVHKERVLAARSIDTARTAAMTGRPCRLMITPYVQHWLDHPEEVNRLNAEGTIPYTRDVRAGKVAPREFYPNLMGQVAGAVNEILPAVTIVEGMVQDAISSLGRAQAAHSKL